MTKEQFKKCDWISASVGEIQRSLIRSELVAKSGNLNYTLDEDIVRIIFENKTWPISRTNHKNEKNLFHTCEVPAKLKLTFLTTTLDGKIRDGYGIFQKFTIREAVKKNTIFYDIELIPFATYPPYLTYFL